MLDKLSNHLYDRRGVETLVVFLVVMLLLLVFLWVAYKIIMGFHSSSMSALDFITFW